MKLLLAKLESLIDEAIEIASSIAFKKDNPQHLYMVCLHGSVLEMATGCLSLYRTENNSAVPVLLRAQLEAYVDLINLGETVDYLKFMHYAYLNQKKKLLDNAIDREKHNVYLEALSSSGNVDEVSDSIRVELARLRKMGIRNLEVRERFERAGLTDLYESVYPMLCQHSHHNLNILEKRHLRAHDGTIGVSYFQAAEKEHHILFIDTIAGVLVDSTVQVFTLFGVELERISGLQRKLDQLRASY